MNQKITIFLINQTGLSTITYLLLSIGVTKYIGIEPKSYIPYGLYSETMPTILVAILSTVLFLFKILPKIFKKLNTKFNYQLQPNKSINYILIISLFFGFLFTISATSRFQVQELINIDHQTSLRRAENSKLFSTTYTKDTELGSAIQNYSFDSLKPISPYYDAIYVPPFTVLHTPKTLNIKPVEQINAESWIYDHTYGFPYLWLKTDLGSSDSAKISLTHFLLNTLIYSILFFIPNLLTFTTTEKFISKLDS
jgi:hypothetical protein